MNLFDFIAGPTLGKILDKFFPDPAVKAQAQLELIKAQQAGEFKEIDAAIALGQQQNDVNKEEAASPDFFRGGWRPAIGWVGAAALFYEYLLQPLLVWASTIWAIPVPPKLDNADLTAIITGMLGLGGMRTIERVQGVITPGK